MGDTKTLETQVGFRWFFPVQEESDDAGRTWHRIPRWPGIEAHGADRAESLRRLRCLLCLHLADTIELHGSLTLQASAHEPEEMRDELCYLYLGWQVPMQLRRDGGLWTAETVAPASVCAQGETEEEAHTNLLAAFLRCIGECYRRGEAPPPDLGMRIDPGCPVLPE